MRRLDAIIERRTTARLDRAHHCASRLVETAANAGFDVTVVGSLAKNTFRSHSDVDLVIRGSTISPDRRVFVERLAADCFRGTAIAYDLVCEADVGADRTSEILDDDRHAAFAKLRVKLDRASEELARAIQHLDERQNEVNAGDWGSVSALALGIQNVYNCIEDVMLGLANDVDGLVPKGDPAQQDLLDQMAVEIEDTRPALLSKDLYTALTELKDVRHLVRHRYGFDLNHAKVRDNVERAASVVPQFRGAVVELERVLLSQDADDNPGPRHS